MWYSCRVWCMEIIVDAGCMWHSFLSVMQSLKRRCLLFFVCFLLLERQQSLCWSCGSSWKFISHTLTLLFLRSFLLSLPLQKSSFKAQAVTVSGKLPKRNWKDCQHNALAPSATERDRKLGCLMSTLRWEQVESGTPLLWANRSSETLLITVRVHSRMVCYLLLLHLSTGPVLLVSWWLVCSLVLTVHCSGKFSRMTQPCFAKASLEPQKNDVIVVGSNFFLVALTLQAKLPKHVCKSEKISSSL